MERNIKFDTIKGFLIFLVVLCHFFELFDGVINYRAYLFIYSFHMPFFVFITGYFSKFKIKKLVYNLVLPYIVYQIIYSLLFANSVSLISPYWLMWYLFAVIIWNITLPLINTKPAFAFLISLIIALIVGFIPFIGEKYALSRVICFYPFFILGLIYRKNSDRIKFPKCKYIVGSMLFLICIIVMYNMMFHIKLNWLYLSKPYTDGFYSMAFRGFIYIISLLWISAFIILFPERKIFLFSRAGKHSMCIYLLHGFVQRFMLYKFNLFVFNENQNILLAILISIIILVILGNKYIEKIVLPQNLIGKLFAQRHIK